MRTYAAYIDFRKCFDSVNRQKLFQHLMDLGVSQQFCSIIDFIYRHTNYNIRSGKCMAKSFKTTTGVPQGCKLSSILFSLYVCHLPKNLKKVGPKVGDNLVNVIQYSDDAVILGRTAKELQSHLERLERYCQEIELDVNTEKTKVQIFHKGCLPNDDKDFIFTINNEKIEIVKEFKYLGMILTTQLSFTKHLAMINVKSKTKVAMIFNKLKSLDLTKDLYIRIFDCYVLPSYLYGLEIWNNKVSLCTTLTMNAVFTKYLKRYLGLPFMTNNSIVYQLTETHPLELKLKGILSSKHFKEVHPKSDTIKCNACEDTSFQNCNLKKHINIVHNKEKEIKCSSCDYTTDEIEDLNKHIKQVHNKIKVFQCNRCTYTGCKRNQIQRHIKNVHNKDMIKTWTINNLSIIPSFFWRGKCVYTFPKNYKQRKRLYQEVTDTEHLLFCQRTDFHLYHQTENNCVCRYCNDELEHFHKYFECLPFKLYPELSIF